MSDDNPYTAAGQTANFRFFYLTTLGANGSAIAAGMKQHCEQALTEVKGWFGLTPPGLPFTVYIVDDVDGANHGGCADTEINVGIIKGAASADLLYSVFLMAEVVEVFEAAVGHGWYCRFSNGEALSRVLPCDIDILRAAKVPPSATIWLYQTPANGIFRQNWIDFTDGVDTDPFSVGCSVLFLNWLHFVVGKPWDLIIQNGGERLANVYQNLTGQANGWQQFKTMVDTRFPANKPGLVKDDNPFRAGPAVGA
jgi:hypothetical protein